MECEFLPKCAFFEKYCTSNNLACQGFINRYCKGNDMKNCKRMEYRQKNGTPPPVDMMPSGLILKDQSTGANV